MEILYEFRLVVQIEMFEDFFYFLLWWPFCMTHSSIFGRAFYGEHFGEINSNSSRPFRRGHS